MNLAQILLGTNQTLKSAQPLHHQHELLSHRLNASSRADHKQQENKNTGGNRAERKYKGEAEKEDTMEDDDEDDKTEDGKKTKMMIKQRSRTRR